MQKLYRINYIFQRCNTQEEQSFRARQLEKYGYHIVCCGCGSGGYVLIATRDKIRHTSDILGDNDFGPKAFQRKHCKGN